MLRQERQDEAIAGFIVRGLLRHKIEFTSAHNTFRPLQFAGLKATLGVFSPDCHILYIPKLLSSIVLVSNNSIVLVMTHKMG